MEGLRLLAAWWQYIQNFYTYCAFCVQTDVGAPICRDFWTATIGPWCALAVLGILYAAKRMLTDHLDMHRYRRRLAERARIADQEVMEQHIWRGDDAADVNLSQHQLAEEIRKAVEARKAATKG